MDNTISPEHKIKTTILLVSATFDKNNIPPIHEIESLFEELKEDDFYEVIKHFMYGSFTTDIGVGAQMYDGTFVGWNPQDINWMGNSYPLKVLFERE